MKRSRVVEGIVLVLALGAMPPSARAQDAEAGAVAVPDTAAPEYAPPAAGEVPAPPAEAAPSREAAAPAGQWVYTSQYGWVWMPYGDAYAYVPPGGGAPNMYVYYPVVGWTWVIAPWVWGWGPMPYFGVYGWYGYGWYGYGYGHWYGYAGPYAGWAGAGYWYGGRWYGGYGYRVAPAPPRGAYPARAVPAPVRLTAPPASRAVPAPAGRAYPGSRPAAAPPRSGSVPRAGHGHR
jgi:hypothetical protein